MGKVFIDSSFFFLPFLFLFSVFGKTVLLSLSLNTELEGIKRRSEACDSVTVYVARLKATGDEPK